MHHEDRKLQCTVNIPQFYCSVQLTDGVLDGAVESIDDGRATVRDPVGFVDRFAQSVECVVQPKLGQVQH